MIRRLQGVIREVTATSVVLDVSGVGYEIAVRNPADFPLEEEALFHTHLAVRENALDLYGFITRDELDMFEHLLKLPKIGPKSAMQILVQADIELLKKSIAAEDPTYLSKMSGIGKKSAEKIVAGLKDTFEEMGIPYDERTQSGDGDVLDALMALGYTQKDARDALQKIPPEITETNARITEALKQMAT